MAKKIKDDNRVTMSSPTHSMRQRPQSQLTPAQIKAQEQAQERLHQLTQKMVARKAARHNWRNKPRLMRRIQNTLAKDSVLRNAVFTVVKGGAIAFMSLDPRTQLYVVKNVDRTLRIMAQNAANKMQPPTLDPNDVTNPFNQANPTSLTNQQEAIQQGIIMKQDNQQAQIDQAMNNVTANEQQQNEDTSENNTAAAIVAVTLTAAEVADIAAHNQAEYGFNPSPKPGSQSDDKELKQNEKTLEHVAEKESLDALKELKASTSKDKTALIDSLKGASVAAKKPVEEVGMKVGMSLAKGAFAAAT